MTRRGVLLYTPGRLTRQGSITVYSREIDGERISYCTSVRIGDWLAGGLLLYIYSREIVSPGGYYCTYTPGRLTRRGIMPGGNWLARIFLYSILRGDSRLTFYQWTPTVYTLYYAGEMDSPRYFRNVDTTSRHGLPKMHYIVGLECAQRRLGYIKHKGPKFWSCSAVRPKVGL